MTNRRSISRRKLLRAATWVAQGLIFLAFLWAGSEKLLSPIADLARMWPWTGDLPPPIVRTLGVIDLLGGIGVLLPDLTRIKPRLTTAAAVGCVLLQLCAMIFHISRGEAEDLPVNLVFLALLVFILWGRRRTSAMARPPSDSGERP
ncbi:DoxX family protein [Salinisphaera sp. Q1T1-3]|uniref:DoxX family protein n=1 Tax=Salinisphaera sp. Q1T1-3 TaxID=2321229 RepID=UPI000E74522E|nr:DoxX family protein [Salinisphaera sp. Q1T1-3]RJS93679.1 DoxX family protein [Salinisphaera sp. Q1T1-3]